MAIRQSQIQSSQQLVDQFRDFFNSNRYESKGRDNHSYFGSVDVYHMNDFDSQKVREAKNRQLENIHLNSNRFSSTYNQPHRQPLGPYNCSIHKSLPDRVAVKTIQPTQSQANAIRDYLASYNGPHQSQQYRSPEFTRFYAADDTEEGLKLFFEYNTTLNEDIRTRQDMRNPYSEELLWKLLFDLVSASTKLNPQQALNDIRPSKLAFNDYQVQVLPFEVGNGRDIPLFNKWTQGEQIFYSQELLNDFKNQQNQSQSQSLRASQTFRTNFLNESFQIGLTVLAAGLLLTEEQVGVNQGQGFDQQRLNQLLNDFGAIYSRKDRLLHIFLSELLLGSGRQNPSSIYNLLRPSSDYIQFLESNFKQNVRNYLTQSYNYVQLEQQLGLTSHNSQLSHLWDRYRSHFYVELVQRDNSAQELDIQRRNEQTQRIIAEQERRNQLLLQQPGIRRPNQQSSYIQQSQALRSSGVHNSSYPAQFTRDSQIRGSNIQQSVFRSSQINQSQQQQSQYN
ncbi:hypothetical protein PPERSA_07690 [Pseudocohnilembus persalinus]|uniref:Uncharacterized protein n=1 Tax=Pseudocohnilembus persalinus TaxID=266149 RepID=A0A0V0QIH3_PSEPJ|nr:hypothetical protein PPERSA_07690 [Pseudocohnilembus persalinus]|eukprot:KRX02045.1 hypothetical protein PPERSA_07690 [Pseudocohnilembus persalinus]